MSRPLRIEYPNAFYHVMNRGSSRQSIYHIDDDYKMFLEAVKESSKLFNIRIIGYSLMSNHYHLLIQTPKANLSRAMRHLNGVYTQRFNRRHKKDGPLFRGRYKAILIQEDEYLTHLIRYVHLNPVQANLVEDPQKYPWSSHKAYLKGKNEVPWLHVRLGLAFFSNKLKKALKAYREFMKNGIDSRTKAFYDKKHQNPILGDPDFMDHIKEKYLFGNQTLSTEIPDKRKMEGATIAKRILEETARSYKKPQEALTTTRRGERNEARSAALLLTRELSGLRLSEIAPIFKSASYKTISTGCHRFKARLAKKPDLRRQYDRLSQRCSQGEI